LEGEKKGVVGLKITFFKFLERPLANHPNCILRHVQQEKGGGPKTVRRGEGGLDERGRDWRFGSWSAFLYTNNDWERKLKEKRGEPKAVKKGTLKFQKAES